MQSNFAQSLKLALQHEGQFANHPEDPGGATMRGVTLTTFRRYYGAGRTVNDLRNIRPEQIAHIYRDGYWDSCRCDDLPVGVDYAVFDSAVNSGPGRAAEWLQSAAGATVDGAIGPRTLACVARTRADTLINKMLDERMAFLRALKTWRTFGTGWSRRVAEVRASALKMARGQ